MSQFQNLRGIYMEKKIMHINAKGKDSLGSEDTERKTIVLKFGDQDEDVREISRTNQPRTLNWIPFAPGIQFSTRPATWNEQNSNSFHLSELGQRAVFTSFRGSRNREFGTCPLLFYALG